MKCLWVSPGMRLSYQRHQFRAEHWFIVQGKAEVTLDGEISFLQAGESIQFPTGTWHRIANTGGDELIFVEVQTGISFEEADIERKDDDFGRVV